MKSRFAKSKKVNTILWIGVGMVIGFLLMKYVLQEFPNPFNNP